MENYLFDPKTKVFKGLVLRSIDKAKTLAIKRTVFNSDPPLNSTTKKPNGEIGKCWFVKGKWVDVNPNKKPVLVSQKKRHLIN